MTNTDDTTQEFRFIVEDNMGKLADVRSTEDSLPLSVMYHAQSVFLLNSGIFTKCRGEVPASVYDWLKDHQLTLAQIPRATIVRYSTDVPQRAYCVDERTQFYCGPEDFNPWRVDRYGDLELCHGNGQQLLVLNWKGFERLIEQLSDWVRKVHPDLQYVYAPPRGGLVLAVTLSHRLGLKMLIEQPWIPDMRSKTLWVDDVYGTGQTFNAACGDRPTNRFGAYAVWGSRMQSLDCWYGFYAPGDTWIVFPWESDAPDVITADEQDYRRRRATA